MSDELPAKKPRGKHDWDALFVEWVQADTSLSQFQLAKKIARQHFYRMTQARNWLSRRDDIKSRAMKAAEKSVVREMAQEWKEQEKLWRAVEIQAAAILKRTLTPDGKLLDPLSPANLATLTVALERALKARKLLAGEATENIAANVTGAEGSVHAEVVGMVNERRKAREAAPIDVKPEPPDAA